MKTKDIILARLKNSSSYISGEALAGELGLSRNAISKAIKSLKEEGYDIEAVNKLGYQLIDNPDVLSASAIKSCLTGPAAGLDLEVRDIVTSTNTLLKDNSSDYSGRDYMIAANEQTAGKGRLGRSFHSPSGDGVYFSLIVHPKMAANDAKYLTTAIATSVARAISDVCHMDAKIKWVNDIYVDNKKVCGILTEGAIDFETGGLEYAVIGTGINITEPKTGYPEAIKDVAGALYKADAPKGIKNQLVAQVLNYFYEYYEKLAQKTFLEEYINRSFLIGETVKVIGNITKPDDFYLAKVKEIDDDCQLVVVTEEGKEVTLATGEVSIRKV